MSEHTVDVGGRKLRVLESGDPDGRVVFALHGTPGARVQWPDMVEDAEARGIRLIGYDRPGYAGSDPMPGRKVVDAAHDVAAIADALDIERFAVHGGSGGGPHALACTQLTDRVVAVASLAGVAPWEAEGLDWLEGMGQDNLDEFGAALEGEEVLRRYLLAQRDTLLASSPQAIAEALESLLCPPDRACLTGALGEFIHQQLRLGIESTVEGWLEDDLAFEEPWGFELDNIDVPVQVWHGTQDQFVPVAHGYWLAERIPGAEAHIYEDDGHLTLQVNRIGDVHAWLLERF
ncbi:MAG TPA: alpha/beta fold hydrolase [Gaiellaceae bacterium]